MRWARHPAAADRVRGLGDTSAAYVGCALRTLRAVACRAVVTRPHLGGVAVPLAGCPPQGAGEQGGWRQGAGWARAVGDVLLPADAADLPQPVLVMFHASVRPDGQQARAAAAAGSPRADGALSRGWGRDLAETAEWFAALRSASPIVLSSPALLRFLQHPPDWMACTRSEGAAALWLVLFDVALQTGTGFPEHAPGNAPAAASQASAVADISRESLLTRRKQIGSAEQRCGKAAPTRWERRRRPPGAGGHQRASRVAHSRGEVGPTSGVGASAEVVAEAG